MEDVTSLTAIAMADKIRRREISPVEVVEAHLRKIERLNPKLNAFVQVDAEGALLAARAAESSLARGIDVGPLCGVPVSVKSSIGVARLRCEAGTRLRKGVVAETDAPLVARLRGAGAIILGTTNTPELLMAWETDNTLYGRTNNPWDLSRTAGGSSGGESAAIAAGCSAGGVGSDGGGSIRVPAHFTGICGLKPTPGRIPATGHFPDSVGPFALLGVVGPMARTVADVTALFEAMQGPDYGDPSSVPVPLRNPRPDQLKKIHIGFFEEDGRTPVTPETRVAVQRAAEALKRAGFDVSPYRPDGLEAARQLWWKIFGGVGAMLLGAMFAGHESDISPVLKDFLARAATLPEHTASSLLQTWIERDVVRAQVLSQMQDRPVLLCPVAAVPAFRHGERQWTIDGTNVEYLDAWSYCEWFNLLGCPAAVVPVGTSREGLPIGVQIVGRPWEEEMVLAVAQAVEQQVGPYQRPPP